MWDAEKAHGPQSLATWTVYTGYKALYLSTWAPVPNLQGPSGTLACLPLLNRLVPGTEIILKNLETNYNSSLFIQ